MPDITPLIGLSAEALASSINSQSPLEHPQPRSEIFRRAGGPCLKLDALYIGTFSCVAAAVLFTAWYVARWQQKKGREEMKKMELPSKTANFRLQFSQLTWSQYTSSPRRMKLWLDAGMGQRLLDDPASYLVVVACAVFEGKMSRYNWVVLHVAFGWNVFPSMYLFGGQGHI